MSVERIGQDCSSEHTAEDWVRAVRRSIETMREDLGEEHSLRSLAYSARLSPFYFHRIFVKVTDSTPARFLTAWRMAEAKRMLAYSSANVTDICMRTGYSSLGTFITQFTRMVGVSPGRFRRLINTHRDRPFNELLRDLSHSWPAADGGELLVTVHGGPAGVPAIVGLFSSGIPQERPAACTVVDVPGAVTLARPPGRTHYPLVMSFDESVTVVEALAASDLDRCYVGGGGNTPAITALRAREATVDIQLRHRRLTDPPIVLALPLLIAANRKTAERTIV